MKHMFAALLWLAAIAAPTARADHRDLVLFVSPDLADAGLMRFVIPRFALKTGIGVHVTPLDPNMPVPPGDLVLQQGPGTLVLQGLGQEFAISPPDPGNKAAVRLHDWLLSDIGQRTIGQFAPDGGVIFTAIAGAEPKAREIVLSGNAQRGEALAYAKCGRCHVIGDRNRMKGIGSTPSFALLRSFDNWLDRFDAFYALNPHPSFTQIDGITAPFNETRPPPISPLVLTQQEHDDIVAYAKSIAPVDLGAPLVHQ